MGLGCAYLVIILVLGHKQVVLQSLGICIENGVKRRWDSNSHRGEWGPEKEERL